MWAYLALAGAQLVSGQQQADLIRRNGDIQSSINDMNAKYAELDAFNARAAGDSEAARYADIVNSTVASQKNAFAANNVDVNYGSAKELQNDSKLQGFMNVLEIQKQGREKALGYETQAINTRLGGQMYRLQSEMDAGATVNKSFFSAVSTGISGYDRSQSTGTGEKSRSGTNNQSWKTSAASSQPSWFFGNDPRPHAQQSQYS